MPSCPANRSDIALQAGLQANGDGLRSAPVELDRIALPASFTRVWNLFSAYRCGQVKFEFAKTAPPLSRGRWGTAAKISPNQRSATV